MAGFEIVQLAGCLYYFIDPWIAKFNYIPCSEINKMIMLHAMIGLLELGDILSKLMLHYKIAVQQQLNRIVQSCPADSVVFVFHENIQGFNIEMTIPRIDLIQNSKTFRSFPVTFAFEVFCKYLFYSVPGLFRAHN